MFFFLLPDNPNHDCCRSSGSGNFKPRFQFEKQIQWREGTSSQRQSVKICFNIWTHWHTRAHAPVHTHKRRYTHALSHSGLRLHVAKIKRERWEWLASFWQRFSKKSKHKKNETMMLKNLIFDVTWLQKFGLNIRTAPNEVSRVQINLKLTLTAFYRP